MKSVLAGIFCLILSGVSLNAAAVTDREAAVRGDRITLEKDPRWNYNDYDRAFERARLTGRPVLVVLRCVPCLACAGIDASVLNEPALGPLLDQFVCVRVINANALDLSRFQFDYDLSFSVMFFNGNGTVYGRYGSWTHQKNALDKTTSGFKEAMQGALALHRGFPENRASLAGKQGGPTPFKTPVEIPELAVKYKRDLDWQGKVVQSCVHCHQIGDAFRAFYRSQSNAIPEQLIYPWPSPESIGLKLADDHRGRVETIIPGSVAAKAGLAAGDDLLSVSGQPLLSSADFSWVLHQQTGAGTLPVVLLRGGVEKKMPLILPADWKAHVDISDRVGTWGMRAMALGGMRLEELPEDQRTARGLSPNSMALFVKHVGEYGNHAAAKKAGVQKSDILIAMDGHAERLSESELIGSLLKSHRPGEKVKATVLRDSARIEIVLPMQ